VAADEDPAVGVDVDVGGAVVGGGDVAFFVLRVGVGGHKTAAAEGLVERAVAVVAGDGDVAGAGEAGAADDHQLATRRGGQGRRFIGAVGAAAGEAPAHVGDNDPAVAEGRVE
jgi:hypothetical protein